VLSNQNDTVLRCLRQWRDDLINVTRRNRLLYFNDSRKSLLEITSPHYSALIEALLKGSRKGLTFFEPAESSGALFPTHPPAKDRLLVTSAPDASSMRTVLKRLERTATQELLDKGLNVLYLAVGLLHWQDAAEQQATSPVLLLPVGLSHEGPAEPPELNRGEDDAAVNPALSLVLEHDFGLRLPQVEDFDEADLSGIIPAIEAAVLQKGWTLSPRVFLSTFSFHKEVMFRDLKDNESLIAESPLVRALVPGVASFEDLSFEVSQEDDLDEKHPPEELTTILDADASQRQAIVAAQSGRSFVMDGPPGTGKSQTIANVIADSLARNKTVLFVSEKAPALDVVFSRLEAAGLGEFVLELHSHKATRKQVAAELGKALETRLRAPAPFAPEQLERLRSLREELSGYAAALNETRRPLGHSLHDVLGLLSRLHRAPQAPAPEGTGATLDSATLAKITDIATSLSHAWGPVSRGEDFVWRDLADSRFDSARKAELGALLDDAESSINGLRAVADDDAAQTLLAWNQTEAGATRLAELLEYLETRPSIPQEWLTVGDFAQVSGALDELETLAREIGRVSARLDGLLGADWPALDWEGHPRFVALASRLEMLGFPSVVSTGWSEQGLEATAARLASTSTFLREAATQAAELGATLGVQDASGSLVRASQIAELGSLVATPAKPEPAWLDPSAVNSVREALAVLQALVQEWSGWEKKLQEVFSSDVLDLDLEALCVRFETAHRGFGKLRRTYWKDRRLLASRTRSGRFGRSERAHLREALQWKKQQHRLSLAEKDHAPAIGDRYYRGITTDFERLSLALGVAEKAMTLAGRGYDQNCLARQLGLGGESRGQLVSASRQLLEEIGSCDAENRALPEALWNGLRRLPLLEAARRCDELALALRDVGELVARVSRVLGGPADSDLAAKSFQLRREAAELMNTFAGVSDRSGRILGPRFRGLPTPWQDLRDDVAWTKGLRDLVCEPVPAPTAKRLLTLVPAPHLLRERLSRWAAVRADLVSSFESPQREVVHSHLTQSFDAAVAFVSHLRGTLDDVEEWQAFRTGSQALTELGLGAALDFCRERRVTSVELPRAIERCVLQSWADSIIKADGRLARLRSGDRDQLVEDFRRLDKEYIRHTVSVVAAACNSRRPTVIAGAAAVVRREAEKLRRHKPIRVLLEEAGSIATAVKPCFMMSPLSVSSFLPPRLRFDVVVFDEASQVRPSDAINCIYRGNQLIVAGDQKQLPPTSFFELGLDAGDDWSEELPDDFESILDLSKASGSLTSIPLRWHYRSQHEDLITFSNYSFYDGRLITFPGSNAGSGDLGVELYFVPGVYRRGGPRDNPVEAEKVMERVLHHTRNHPDLSVGVVAFSEAQATTIEAAWDKWRGAHREIPSLTSEDPLNAPFVKNLETVQGDERDIIVFSIGYGPDELGRFLMNFGPINAPGGQRRLNVAITRARRRVEVVTSVSAADFRDTASSEGVRHLRRFLDFAARTENKVAALGMELGASERDCESPFEEEVARVIRSWGYEVEPQVGCANYRVDLGVRHPTHPGVFVVGVECDGAMYHSSRVARDRDRLRAEVLRRLGWNLHRLWGPAWYRNRRAEEARLKAVIEAAIQTGPGGCGGGHASAVASLVPLTTEPEQVDFESVPLWTCSYEVANPEPPSAKAAMHEESAERDLQRMIREVVGIEGPIHREVLIRRVREAWGVYRAGSRIREAFDRALNGLRKSDGVTRDRHGFYVRAGSEVNAVRIPKPGVPGSARKVEEVHPLELELALLNLVTDARSAGREELLVLAARLFGWERVGSEIAASLNAVVTRLLRNRRLTIEGENLTVASGTKV
jgi:hypothetical protein